jgi:NAD(P)-dependent dehydrogenase (short-subunit alcohol dehydrogenase family)
MAISMSLEGQVALVTGAGKGIGKATALTLAAAGADVALCARTQSDVDAVASSIRAMGRKALALSCDVAEEDQVKTVIAKTLETFGHLDVLVNNAGISGGMTHLVDFDMAEWDRIVAVNLRGTALCTKYALPSMKARKRGSIINISSTWGRTAGRGKPAYVATKWAIIGLTQAVALEEGGAGIRVNCVVPGYTMTDMLRRNREAQAAREGKTFEQTMADVAALSPQNRVVSAEEVAEVIVWLASDKAVSVHGQTINANAALYMN